MKSKIPCEMIKDLLPLYIDELVSETTEKEMQLHLSECEKCSRSLQNMKNPEIMFDEEEDKEIKFLKKNKMTNRMIVIASIICSVIVIALISLILYQRAQVKFDIASFAVEAGVGDTFLFGEYEQDGNLENGPEPIEWIVLRNKDNTLYAISKYGLENKPYHDINEPVTWEECSLREWLNGEFYEEAFSKEEKAMILETELQNADNPYYGTPGGNDTIDKVFLLSYKEFEPKAFAYQNCMPTVYGEKQGIIIDDKIAIQCKWWLRTPGIQITTGTKNTTATFAALDLGAQSIGIPVDYDGAAVRPCINIRY